MRINKINGSDVIRVYDEFCDILLKKKRAKDIDEFSLTVSGGLFLSNLISNFNKLVDEVNRLNQVEDRVIMLERRLDRDEEIEARR